MTKSIPSLQASCVCGCAWGEQEKGLLLQKAIESNNNRATWVSVIQVCASPLHVALRVA